MPTCGDGRSVCQSRQYEFVAAITEGSVKSMGLKNGDAVTVAVKATEVMVGK